MLQPQPRKPLFWIACLVTIALVGYADFLTGKDVSLSIFYLIPISLAAAFIGPVTGIFFAALATTIWMSCAVANGQKFATDWLIVWNSLMRFSFSAVTSLCISKTRSVLRIQAALLAEMASTSVNGWEIGSLLPICAGCKRERTDAAYLAEVRAYIEAHPNARFIPHDCPHCRTAQKIEAKA